MFHTRPAAVRRHSDGNRFGRPAGCAVILAACLAGTAACSARTADVPPRPHSPAAPASAPAAPPDQNRQPSPDPGRQPDPQQAATQGSGPGLLGHVPSYLAASCVETAPDISGATEALECDPSDDPQQVLYWQFDNRADLDAALQPWVADILTGTGDCRSGFDGHVTYQVGGSTAGDLVCSLNDGWAWSDWNTGILAVAYDQYFHAPDFYQWWANNGSTTDS